MLQLGAKCWISAFNAQSSRLIIVVVQVRAVKIYVARVEALSQKERQDETQFTTKIDGFLSFNPPWMLM
jgi:predicted oxidoreductase (fatty acid repression mutant protein)